MRHFAEHGFQDSRVSDIADNLGIAKASVFQHFGSKAVRSFRSYMPAPADALGQRVFLKLSAIAWPAPGAWWAKTGPLPRLVAR
jgi:AcrR family transcriptional regulator